MKIRNFAIILLSLTFANTCFAGLVGTWKLPKRGIVTSIEYQDDNNIRIAVGESMYLLFKDGASYMITGQSVVDADAFRNEIKDWAVTDFLAERMKKRAARVETRSISKTERTEKVAGITGNVYEVTMQDPDSKETLTREMVLTKDERMVKLKLIMDNFADKQMNKISRPEFTAMHEIMQSSFDKDSAVLRYGDRFELSSIEELDIDPKRFQLPEGAEIKTMPGFTEIGSILKLMMPTPGN